jgi:hypothetical protein
MSPIAHIGVTQGRALVIDNRKADSLSHEQRHSTLVWWVRKGGKSGAVEPHRGWEWRNGKEGDGWRRFINPQACATLMAFMYAARKMWPEKRRAMVNFIGKFGIFLYMLINA